MNINDILEKQRKFYLSNRTLSPEFRLDALKTLERVIKDNQDLIEEALHRDLGKNAFTSYMTEIGMVLSEIRFMKRHLKRYAKRHPVITSLAQMVGCSYTQPTPYGNVLIMSPWNYPFMLALDPLVDAIAAGNTAIIKPSAYAPATSDVIELLIQKCFDEEFIAVVTGGRKENTELLNKKFDYIFFTGSVNVGKTVMNKASENLTPVTLELGGKSPCIVDSSADIKVSARRIVFGKFLNCGQTCVAPDYIYVQKDIADEFIQEVIKETNKQYTTTPLEDPTYGKIVNKKHFERILNLINPNKVVLGGEYNEDTNQIAPTIMTNVNWEDPVMQEEIFGPVMPILEFENIEDLVELLRSKPHPLALYLFTKDKTIMDLVTEHVQFGGGCINDTIIQLATSHMGFGGVGDSGMGSYHGKAGFDTFTHYKSMVRKGFLFDLPFRYPPYTKFKEDIIKIVL